MAPKADKFGATIGDKCRQTRGPDLLVPRLRAVRSATAEGDGVVELLDYSFDSLAWARDASLADDYADSGFVEIWLADYSTMEAFGEVRLIGLYPPRFWGTHRQPALEGKPYG